ncbi:hypothetical protein JCM5296_004930 [Sporobolomyces johnsonii]
MIFRPSSPLPLNSSRPPSTSGYHALHSAFPSSMGFLSRKPLSLFLVSFLAGLTLISFLSLVFSPYSLLLSSDPAFKPFSKRGLSPRLFRQLDAIDHRAFVLHPVERPFARERSAEDEVPWSDEPLIPARGTSTRRKVKTVPTGGGADAGGDGAVGLMRLVNEPVPERAIEVFPRKVELTPGAPGVYEHLPGAEQLLFGIATTVDRAKYMSELWKLWMVPRWPEDEGTPSCLVLLSDEEEPSAIRELKHILEERDLPCEVRTSSYERYEVRVLNMVQVMRDYAEEIGKPIDWFVFNDDDTFWVDIRTLRRLLSKYDPSEKWFVGATTEAQNQLQQFGRMAFGGAGMLISAPLLSAMYSLWPECHDRYKNSFGGDEMITRCAALAKGATKQTVTTEERGLHQFDVPGDATGLLQSGIPIVNLHHFMGGGWVHLFGYGTYRTDMQQILLIRDAAAFLGGDNMFKRYVFGNGRWLFVNGYSITLFEEPLTKEDMPLMEHTWYDGYRLSFDDRPRIHERHDSNGSPVKQTFYINGVHTISPNSALFTYAQADSWDEHMTSSERVLIQVLYDGDSPTKIGMVQEQDSAALS